MLKDMDFCHLQENLKINMDKINGYCNKNGNRCCKTVSKWVAQKTAETTGDLIGNKVADKITLASKTKSKEKENETNKRQKTYTPPVKRQSIIDILYKENTKKLWTY